MSGGGRGVSSRRCTNRIGFSFSDNRITNIVLAYAFAQCLPSFMSELKRPQDYKKSLWTLGMIEICFYTIIGATIYYYKGQDVKSPALLSIAPRMQKVVFGVSLPVIFISGSINSQTAAKFIYDLIYINSPKHKYMNTKQGIFTWIGLGLVVTTIGESEDPFSCKRENSNRMSSNSVIPPTAFISAMVIPDFSTFLGLLAALFAACFSYTLPACMYFKVLRKDKMRSPQGQLKFMETGLNAVMFILGVFVLFVGCGECQGIDANDDQYAYSPSSPLLHPAACIISLKNHFKSGVGAPFAC